MRYRTVAGLAVASLLVTTPAGRGAVAAAVHGAPAKCSTCHSTPGSGTAAVTAARRYLGVPYLWGGTNPATGLDCSAFTQRAYRDVGISLPRTARGQQHAGQPVHGGIRNARPGDLLFYEPDPAGDAHHVAMYIGGGRLIEAPQAGMDVHVRSVYGTPFAIRRITKGGVVNYRKIVYYLGAAFVLYFVVQQPAESVRLLGKVGGVFTTGARNLQHVVADATGGESSAAAFLVLSLLVGLCVGAVVFLLVRGRFDVKGEK